MMQFFKHISVLTLFLLLPLLLDAKENENVNADKKEKILYKLKHKRADAYYDKLAYTKAINKYNKLTTKGYSPDSLIRKLAISYFKTNNAAKAETLFKSLVIQDDVYVSDILEYAQILKYNGKYNEADIWINKYIELNGEDARGRIQHKTASFIREMMIKEKYRIEPVYFNSKNSDFGATVQNNKIIYTSTGNNTGVVEFKDAWKNSTFLDIYEVNINKPANYKNPDLLTTGINSRYHDGPACFSKDGKEVFITRSGFKLGFAKNGKNNTTQFLLYEARKKGDSWGNLTELPFNGKNYSCGHASISYDNQTLYFSSDMPGGYGGADIYKVNREGDSWGKPENLGASINTTGNEMFPFVGFNNEVYFSSDGHQGFGGLDIFLATLISENEYGILNLGYPLNSSSDDFSFFLMDNEMEGFFASNREGGMGEDDIYKFLMLEQPTYFINLIISIEDPSTLKPVNNVTVTIFKETGIEIASEQSNSIGQIEILIEPETKYILFIDKPGYISEYTSVTIERKDAINNAYKLELSLEDIVNF